MADQMTFRRYEIKYRVDDDVRDALTQEIFSYMQADEHGVSSIQSLYFDTPDFLLARRSMEHPLYKEKLRLRSYGLAGPDTTVFLELKKKYSDVVYKRRIAMREAEVQDLIAAVSGCRTCGRSAAVFSGGKCDSDTTVPDSRICRSSAWFAAAGRTDRQIAAEIGNAFERYHDPAPRMLLLYDREAFYARDDHEFRVTFDRNIRWRKTDLALTKGLGGEMLLPAGTSLMEVKAGGAIPLWFVHLLSRYGLRKTSFSKYGTACALDWMRRGRIIPAAFPEKAAAGAFSCEPAGAFREAHGGQLRI